LACDFPNPCTTCTYYRTPDYGTKCCPQLFAKWYARGNKNPNPNPNVKKISAEKLNKGPRIVVVMHRGDRTRDDRMNEGKKTDQWVSKPTRPIPTFNLEK
jgi:hypothetical protein